jgi:adenosine deaminase
MRSWLDYFPSWQEPVSIHPALADVLDLGPRDEAELAYARHVDQADKTEVHVHAEAAVPPSFYAERSGKPAGAAAPFTDFGDFLRRWMRNLGHIRESADYARLGRAFVADRQARNIVRCECHLSPLDTSLYRARVAPGLPVLSLADNLRHFAAGVRDGMTAAGGRVRVRVVVDLVSVATPDDLQAAYAALAPFVASADNRDDSGKPIIVAIGLGGPEQPARAAFFQTALQPFRALGLRLDLHSGEQPHVTPTEHAEAVSLLQPDRVGHGFRGASDGYYFPGAIAACPLSNVLLRCHPDSLTTHPIADMYARTLSVSINTDDPLLLGTNLVLEYVALRRAFGFDREFFAATQATAERQLLAPR